LWYCCLAHRHLRPFPTRRSSDLLLSVTLSLPALPLTSPLTVPAAVMLKVSASVPPLTDPLTEPPAKLKVSVPVLPVTLPAPALTVRRAHVWMTVTLAFCLQSVAA